MKTVESNKTVDVKELTTVKMTTGNEDIYPVVIHQGKVKEWVGIGWAVLGQALAKDYEKFPVVEG